MNKKEVSELKKNFSEQSDLFTLNRVVTAFVDAEKQIRCTKSEAYHNIPSEESECYMNTLRRVLTGTLGKGLVEYEFPREAYEEGGSQQLLYTLLQTKLEDESAVSVFLDHLVKNLEYVSTYAILIGHCTYTVFNKTRDGAENPYDSTDFSYLTIAICPVELRVDGLVYKEPDNAILRKTEYDRIVAEIPTDGCIYPTFTGRGPDVNHVLYYARKPKAVNASMIEEVLGCKFVCTAVQEKESFHALMEEIVAEELSYTVITDVNEKLRSIAEEYQHEEDLPTVDDIQLRDVLLDSGVSQEKAEQVQQRYREMSKEKPLTVSNVTESKTKLVADGITIQIGKDATDKVRTQCIQGRRYLLIDLEEAGIEINGMQVTLQEAVSDAAAEQSAPEDVE